MLNYQLLLLSRFSHVWLLATPWTEAYQAPPPMGFSRKEYWSGVPLPSPHTTLYMVLTTTTKLKYGISSSEKQLKLSILKLLAQHFLFKHIIICTTEWNNTKIIMYKYTHTHIDHIFLHKRRLKMECYHGP